MRSIVILRIGDLRCALDRAAVREIVLVPALTRPPSLPSSIEGVLNLGGEALIAVDLAKLLGVAPDQDIDQAYRHVVVMGHAGEGLALLVDRAEDVRAIDDAAIVPISQISSLNACVVSEVDLDGTSVHVLDDSRILLAAEQARFAEIRNAEQARLDALAAT